LVRSLIGHITTAKEIILWGPNLAFYNSAQMQF
jgi:hypothetical protein